MLPLNSLKSQHRKNNSYNSHLYVNRASKGKFRGDEGKLILETVGEVQIPVNRIWND